jgi:hypothetical protein
MTARRIPIRLLWLAVGIAVLIALPLVVKSSFAINIFIRILLFSFIGVWGMPPISGLAPTPRPSCRSISASRLGSE